jgi:tetratricopeptide (TPR) repeat protein
MYAVGLIADADKKIEVYKKVAEKFNDVRAYNNIAYLYLLKNDVANAKPALEKVATSTEPSVINNRGCIALLEGDVTGAEKLFAEATNAGPDVKYNLGIIAIINNQYPAAVEYLGGSDSFNQGLSLLLTNKNDAAKNTFTKVETAKGFYGLAIVGARIQDEAMVLTNLRTALGKDAALKVRAKNDLEFLKYFQNDAFKAIVE